MAPKGTGRHSICLPFNMQKMQDLGLDISIQGEDGQVVLEMALGSEPLLHEDFKRHIIAELGPCACDELTEKILVSYAGIALKGTLG